MRIIGTADTLGHFGQATIFFDKELSMETETRKIALACFIGGILCASVALLMAPAFWWFGMLAGIAGGYISYEFREVLRAIPIALRAAKRESVSTWDDMVTEIKEWFSQSHPLFYPGALFALPLVIWFGFYFLSETMKGPGTAVVSILLLLSVYVEAAVILSVPLVIFAFIGARIQERCFWWPFLVAFDSDGKVVQGLEEQGLRRESLTYRNTGRWIAEGFARTVLFFLWTLWMYLAIGVWAMLCFLGRFALNLFKQIHSNKRVLCAIDGTLGGAMSYLWLHSSYMTTAQMMMLVVFGGLLGAGFGVANWEIVSKRILHVQTARS